MISAEAIRRLRQVKEQILAEPYMYNQMCFKGDKNPCESACCIAGWLVWNNDASEFAHTPSWLISPLARDLVGWEFSYRWNLFADPIGWPTSFAERFIQASRLARVQVARAKVAADYIDHIIAVETGGAA